MSPVRDVEEAGQPPDQGISRIIESRRSEWPSSRRLPRRQLRLPAGLLGGELGGAVQELLAGLAVGPAQDVGILLQA